MASTVPYTPRGIARGNTHEAGSSSPKWSLTALRGFASPAPALGAARASPAGPRDTYDTKFSHRYAVSEVFPCRGRRHFSPGDRVNPLNVLTPRDGSNAHAFMQRTQGRRSRGASMSPDRSASPREPARMYLFDATPGTWHSPRRSPVRWAQHSPSRSPSPSEKVSARRIIYDKTSGHRLQHGSKQMRELLTDDIPSDTEITSSVITSRKKQCDPGRNVSPETSERTVRPSSEVGYLRPLPRTGPRDTLSNLSPGVRSLITGEASASLAAPSQSPQVETLYGSTDTKAALHGESAEGDLTHQNWQQEFKLSPRGKGNGPRAVQSVATPFALIGDKDVTADDADAACKALPAEVHTCKQRAELRENMLPLRLRARPKPSLDGVMPSCFLLGSTSFLTPGESTTAGNSAEGSTGTCESEAAARHGNGKAVAGRTSARSPKPAPRGLKPSAAPTPSTAPSTPARAPTRVSPPALQPLPPPPVADEDRLKVVQECKDEVADAVANLMSRSLNLPKP